MRLPLDQSTPWRIRISGGWPQEYDAVVRVWPRSRGGRSRDGGWDWSKPIGTLLLKMSDGIRHVDLTLPPGRYLAALGPVGVGTGMWRAAALATATVDVLPGQVESGETILTVPERLEVDQASLRIETERAPWNARFSIEGPGAYSHSRVIHHGMCGPGTVLHTTYVRGSGLYLISDPSINYVAALAESELSRGYLRVPLPGRLILEARSEVTGLPIEDATFMVEPLHLAEGVRPWGARGELRGPGSRSYDLPVGAYAALCDAEGYAVIPSPRDEGEGAAWRHVDVLGDRSRVVLELYKTHTVTVLVPSPLIAVAVDLSLVRKYPDGATELWDGATGEQLQVGGGMLSFDEVPRGTFHIELRFAGDARAPSISLPFTIAPASPQQITIRVQ